MSGVIGQNLLFIALVHPKKVYVYFIKVIDPAHCRSVYWQNNHLRMLEVKFVQNAPRFVIKKNFSSVLPTSQVKWVVTLVNR